MSHRTLRTVLFGLASLAFVSATQTARAADNTPPEGFRALFNGRDLSGWKGLPRGAAENPAKRAAMPADELAKLQEKANDDMRAHWKIVDGALEYDGKGFSLMTDKDYGNFELYVDWKIGPKGDSGIYVRGAPQVQIWDDPIGSGGLFNNQMNPSKPSKVADKPVGQWNTMYINMVGDKVTVMLNGELVVDNVVLENYWDRNQPIFPTGSIELQHHGNPLSFKNIYLRELPRN